MRLQQAQAPASTPAKLYLSYAQSVSQVKEAQRLRYRVFAEEMGARLSGGEDGIDEDIYDSFC
ncbi:MAG: GNAT family N-acetyltransferase, partial [Sulfuricella sp.]|nr:GNAT family N-acetyltransferase [Sulfuricella sp.]